MVMGSKKAAPSLETAIYCWIKELKRLNDFVYRIFKRLDGTIDVHQFI